ncbi:MAG: ribosomal RNA small subunit methyltransferase A [Bacteroidetes bacterium]|nr:ribosomal RNA small subunit methyltransferase A [Bacteroidota bacterium]MBU1678280.1 ribosomal RNA small subunit methyltransferase A [Bacteroidota bacterium]MBU2507654.1 ribosomal RNA small subunit methyltransferase A [Bacteroidota bacterium]
MKNPKPLKRFGQNYIQDTNIINQIVQEINPSETDKIIEIGPGTGALTAGLYSIKKMFTAVEIDNRVIEDLKEKFPQVNFINKDLLKEDFSELLDRGSGITKIVGNIPYNITSSILFKIIDHHHLVDEVVFMVQDEFARRITAKPRTKDYGIPTVILEYFAESKYCFQISPHAFYPRPKVNSAVIHLYFNKKLDDEVDTALFIKTVKACFGNRRKTLKNSLSNSIFAASVFTGVDLDLSKRAEELELPDFLKLTKYISGKINERK